MIETNEKFNWSDAWFFAALIRMSDSGKLDLSELIAIGDGLNHAIFTCDEIKQGIQKCQRWGLVTITNRRYALTKQAKTIRQELRNVRGGQFAQVDNALKKLNSRRTKLVRANKIKPCNFITEEAVHRGHERRIDQLPAKYKNLIREHMTHSKN